MEFDGDLFDQRQNSLFTLNPGTLSPDKDNPGAPLAHRMRPVALNEFMGQDKILGQGKPLRQWIQADRVPSLIFWGPPGCGKTTLAQIVAKQTASHFESLSAVLAGVKEIKEVVGR